MLVLNACGGDVPGYGPKDFGGADFEQTGVDELYWCFLGVLAEQKAGQTG